MPLRSLVGFERIHLKSGETRKLRYTLEGSALSSVDVDGVRRITPGIVDLWMGGGQPDRRKGLPPVAGIQVTFDVTSSATLAK
jgi:beta-glucosidase